MTTESKPKCVMNGIELSDHGPLSRRDHYILAAANAITVNAGEDVDAKAAMDIWTNYVVTFADALMAEADKEEPK